jgi:hypothetical protein
MRVDVRDGGRSTASGGLDGAIEARDTVTDGPDAASGGLDAAADGLGLLLVDKIAHEWGVVAEDDGRTFWGTIRTGLVPGQTPRSWPEPLVRTEADSAPVTAPH